MLSLFGRSSTPISIPNPTSMKTNDLRRRSAPSPRRSEDASEQSGWPQFHWTQPNITNTSTSRTSSSSQCSMVRIASALLVLFLGSHFAAIVKHWIRFHRHLGHADGIHRHGLGLLWEEDAMPSGLSYLFALSDQPSDYERNKQAHLKKLNNGYVFHIVFSTGCNAFQDWQSYAFFYHVMASGFTGNVSRTNSRTHVESVPLTYHSRFLV